MSLAMTIGSVAAVATTTTTTTTTTSTREVATADGRLAGAVDAASGVCRFAGVPFAAPPVGELRWREPQPVTPWPGVRSATTFGPRAMQPPIYGDMNFRSSGTSEDCLYLNVWTPDPTAGARLPVLVYFYGGGFIAGDASEPRYDGASMAARGIVAVTVNYRLGVFGFLAHPALTNESPNHASGNYGLLDQLAALRWVRTHIGAFGGDPSRVTIAGESAGSMSVSAQMASPLAKGLFARAIGESGSLIGTLPPVPLADAERAGEAFAKGLGASTLVELRALSAERLVKAKTKPGDAWCKPNVDGYLLPKMPGEIYAAGEQSRVPLLAGVNSAEGGAGSILKDASPTVANFEAGVRSLYGTHADAVIAAYGATGDADVLDAAQDLASDRFISYGTWTWADLATKTGGQPTYYYLFAHPRPAMRPAMRPAIGDATSRLATQVAPTRGAPHACEIEYALGNLDGNAVYAWTDADRAVSKTMQSYFANFIKTGDPNGDELTPWPAFDSGRRLVIDAACRPEPMDRLRSRYAVLKAVQANP